MIDSGARLFIVLNFEYTSVRHFKSTKRLQKNIKDCIFAAAVLHDQFPADFVMGNHSKGTWLSGAMW
jgi:hypothetical protein